MCFFVKAVFDASAFAK